MENTSGNKRKIPGMIYIFVSFIPWIIYWILCGMGNALGIIISLTVSLILVVPQIRRRDFNLMDVTSLFYFSIAAGATFIFNLNIFVEKSGFLGYSALFLMALFSLIIKQPYTLQVSKRDYPEIYWKEKSFLTVNNVITGVWAAIYLANAIGFLILSSFTSIFSNILIVFGIAFSIVFPSKAPAYFASKEFKKYDWNVEVNPQKSKGENEYDVIIVGSGIAGLTCGALLSKRGYKTLVLEQHYQVGGYCSSFNRKNFIFNTGVENISGLWEKGPVSYLLKEIGSEKNDLFVKNRMKIIFKGIEINADSLEEFIKVLSDMFPKEKENICAFFDDAAKAHEECHKDAEVYGTPLPPWLIVKVFDEKRLLDYPKKHPHFYEWTNKTYNQKLDEYFANEDLKTLFCALLGYVGTKAEKTSASSALAAVVSYYIHGGYFPKGGAQRFADTLKEVVENHGGKVLVHHKADRILVKKSRVEGVGFGDKIFRSPIVIANANAKTTFLELVEVENLDKEFVEYIKSLKMSLSCFMVFLGLDMDLSDYPTLIENLDDGCSIVINSNADSSLAPKDKASITILTGADYYDFPERGTRKYLEKKKERAEVLIKKAEKVIPNLSKHIIVQNAATPKTFERYTFMPEGAIYAFDQSIGTKRPYFKTPIKGLYLASASTFPGGGIEAAVMSGMICANDVCSWKVKAS
ncbi:MAG: NAD(P)-binding protein [Epsilonproteobacteria bacterium]|nr:NAD(P)-binding protein [Campylobacterota bacterium]